jgi:hypothetical protein
MAASVSRLAMMIDGISRRSVPGGVLDRGLSGLIALAVPIAPSGGEWS